MKLQNPWSSWQKRARRDRIEMPNYNWLMFCDFTVELSDAFGGYVLPTISVLDGSLSQCCGKKSVPAFVIRINTRFLLVDFHYG